MDEEQMEKLEGKIVDLLNKNNPRPDILQAIRILKNIEEAFLGHLDENMSSHSNDKEKR